VETFFVLNTLIEKFGIGKLYSDGMPLLQGYIDAFDKVFRQKCPDLYLHFKCESVPDHLWFGKWLLTLGVDSYPLPVVIRLWDCLLIEGPVFMLKLGIAVVRILRKLLLEMGCEQI
jgi:hypothetical protein